MSALVRFTPSERAFHWVFAAGWLGLLASGLPLMFPGLQGWIRGLPLHLAAAGVWVVALAGVLLLGNRGRLAELVPLGGHLLLALVFPATGPSLHGMLRGRVDGGWATSHHPRWPGEPPPEDRAA